MMSKINQVILFLFLLVPFCLIGQVFNTQERCGTVDYNIQLNLNNPNRISEADFEKWMRKGIKRLRVRSELNTGQTFSQSNNQSITIPVIFHVIHNGEQVGATPNLSSTYINAQIAQLNLDFANLTGSSYPQAADTGIQFCAAKIDPNGNCLAEAGINRVDRNSLGLASPPHTTTYFNSSIQPLTQWNPEHYFNVWIGSLPNGFLGAAQLPEATYLAGINNNNGLAITDGCIIDYKSIGSVTVPNPNSTDFNLGRTLTHEVGHWLGLRHIWGDGGCNLDDYCNDTPSQGNSSAGCPIGNDTCPDPGLDMVENFMDYSNDACMHTFTEDQRDRMLVTLDPIVGSIRRAKLNDSPACDCAPIADFSPSNFSLEICTSNNSIEFKNESTRTFTGTSYQWSFSGVGVSPTNSTQENPIVTITSGGTLTVDLTVTNANGTDTKGPIFYQISQIQGEPVATTLLTPQNGTYNQNLFTSLNWSAVTSAENYLVEVATDASFSSLVYSEITANTSITTPVLQGFTDYFWRVTSINDCNASNPYSGNSSSIWTFKTLSTTCIDYASTDTPLTLPTAGTNSVESIITIPTGLGPITDISISNLSITHSWVSDLEISVTAPDGTNFLLLREICGSQDDVQLAFHDSGLANNSIPCPPTDGNTYQASGQLSILQGADPTGDWTLHVIDNASGDGGQIVSWNLEICTEDLISCPGSLTLDITETDVSCFSGSDGSLTANALGGSTPYQYEWENSSGSPISSNATINNLSPGTYSCTVTDDDGCQQSLTAAITEPSLMTVQETITDLMCAGNSSGEISVTPVGGVSPYSYMWSTNQTSAAITNLTAGIYAVTVTDSNNCIQVETYQVTEPSQMNVTETITNVLCFGDASGEISLNVSGGTGSYAYTWSTGETSNIITAKTAGNYSITVVDMNNCISSHSYTITEPSQDLDILLDIQLDVSCFGDNNGELAVTATGGTSPYSYLWSNGATTPTVSNLNGGTYTITVTDANDCQSFESWNVLEPNALNQQISNSEDITCTGANDGSATLNISGGNGPYNINWSNGESGVTATQLTVGNNIFTITDDQGCVLVDSIQISEPGPLGIDVVSSSNATCLTNTDGSIEVTGKGGTAPYTYSWSTGANSNQLIGLAVGEYFVTVTDDNDCTSEALFVVDSPSFTLNPAIQLPTCDANMDGSITVNPTGDGAPFTYTWFDNSTQNTINSLSAGTYALTITDSNNCSFVESLELDMPIGITIVTSSNDLSCSNTSTGNVYAIASGGMAPYTYIWEDAQGNSVNTTGLEAGDYYVTVTDIHSCVGFSMVTVNPPVTEYTMNNNNQLTGIQNGNADFEVDGMIESNQIIKENDTNVDYDSGISIELKAGFEVEKNSVFHAFIDGCGGAQ